MILFYSILFAVSVFSGATASLVGFGIGSLLTPLLATQLEAGLAIAVVTLPHAFATGFRCWRLRHGIDRQVLIRFGIPSAAGALAGALIYTFVGPSALTRILGCLLLMTAAAHLSGISTRWRPKGKIVFLLALGSGFFGGIAGNQGGLRAAALTAFKLSPKAFVATATATGLIVDAARTPVYLWNRGTDILEFKALILIATIGVLLGTVAGERILLGLSPQRFSMLIACSVGVLGIWLLFGAR